MAAMGTKTKEEKSENENEELKRLLTLGHTRGIEITRDSYNNITLTKRPASIGSSYMIGVDEAGRGPLAGPMVYSLVYWTEDPDTKVYNDSKKVQKEKRTAQYAELLENENIGFTICLLSPLFISANMLCNKKDLLDKKAANKLRATGQRKKQKLPHSGASAQKANSKNLTHFLKNPQKIETQNAPIPSAAASTDPLFVCKDQQNLNDLSISCIQKMLRTCISSNIPVKEIYIDTVGPKVALAQIIKECTSQCRTVKKIVVEEKADSSYQVVAAASILAKVSRDIFIETHAVWKLLYGEIEYWHDLGSGYPADPNTRKWLSKSFIPGFGFLPIFRVSWKPVMDILQEKTEELLGEEKSRGKLVCYLKRGDKR
ncbi:ribonuclease H2 subunit A [Nematocida minor]|uniref:ribonuclease H2 subunit A n=1 Tax=Nematocida minor TaxID=1912983 RepID=UPI00221E4DBB|nr:ribonuclease H2 subunit A [Nematocida minor]KAI5191520.1 ribonuclease H2 subunit A [Nematocida minor]